MEVDLQESKEHSPGYNGGGFTGKPMGGGIPGGNTGGGKAGGPL